MILTYLTLIANIQSEYTLNDLLNTLSSNIECGMHNMYSNKTADDILNDPSLATSDMILHTLYIPHYVLTDNTSPNNKQQTVNRLQLCNTHLESTSTQHVGNERNGTFQQPLSTPELSFDNLFNVDNSSRDPNIESIEPTPILPANNATSSTSQPPVEQRPRDFTKDIQSKQPDVNPEQQDLNDFDIASYFNPIDPAKKTQDKTSTTTSTIMQNSSQQKDLQVDLERTHIVIIAV